MSEYTQYDWKARMISHELFNGLTVKKYCESDRHLAVQTLRGLLIRSLDAQVKNCTPQDDQTLLKFLYARKFDVEEAHQLIIKHHYYRQRHPEVFNDLTLDAEDIRKSIEDGLPGVLNSKDRKGRCVLFMNAANWDCSYGLISIYRALLYILQVLIEDVCNQANGFVIIVDWTQFTFRQSLHLKPGILRLMIEGLQDCFPGRFKGIHFVGQPWYVEAALAVIKPFLKDKIKERIYQHGNNLSTLHDYVAKDILPAEMGGEQPSHNPLIFLKKIDDAK